jgi:glycosyltransferase involved in cell wall biosynthesis
VKVCFVSHSGDKGGAETVLLRMVDGLGAVGVECSVLLPADGFLKDQFAMRQVPHAVFPYRWWAHRDRSLWGRVKDLSTLRLLGPVVSQLRQWDVDLILTNTSVVPVGALAAFLLRKPHVWYIHEFGRADHGLSYYLGSAITGKLVAHLSRVVIVNSKAVGDFYSRYISPENIRIIYPFVEAPPGDGVQPALGNEFRQSRLILLGSYQPGKGQMMAIRALKQLVDQHVKAELVLAGFVGDPAYFEALKRATSEFHLEKLISFQAHRTDPGSIMANGDIILMCSRSEAFGLVTVEGMKMGKPIIGARAGATPELIQEGYNGLLYEPENPADLAAKIRYLLENPAAAKRMGENGRRWADAKFSMKGHIDALLQALNDGLGAHNAGADLTDGLP